jgi:predicted AAA+ superfamily ATPase
VLSELLTPPARLHYWRLQSGQEVDFVVEHGRRMLGIEVKMSAQVGYGDTAALRQFLSAYPQASGGLVVYQGQAVRRLSEKIVAIPWTLLAG